MNKPLTVAELFAGVGGFRLGLEGVPGAENTNYKIIWSNQFEPKTKRQHASQVYVNVFGEDGHTNTDIAKVKTENIPDHDVLVGGFPCQDYSVAKALTRSKGIVGKKGVLWWQIHRVLQEKEENRPQYLILENVDRLLKSPVHQRGRDFAIMLASLSDLGYAVEWRVINAADYGFPQRRRRVFIIGYHQRSPLYKMIKDWEDWVMYDGVLADSFPVEQKPGTKISKGDMKGFLKKLSDNFNTEDPKVSPFLNAGIMIDRQFMSMQTAAVYSGKYTTLKDILLKESRVPEEFYITKDQLAAWQYQKGAKREQRENKRTGHIYTYNEGAMVFPDALDQASRTIITGEGGKSPSRFKHVVKVRSKYRRLTPIELERLNTFPDDHTIGQSDTKRAYLMGNALVVGVVNKLGKTLSSYHNYAATKSLI